MKPVVVLLCVLSLPFVAPLALGMLVGIGAALGFVVSAPVTLLHHAWIARNRLESDQARSIALEAIYGTDRYERLRRYWLPKRTL
jgi:hypothetical protein